MTINFEPGELENKLKEKFKKFDFYLEKYTKEEFFKHYDSIFGVKNDLWSEEQKNIIYNAYLEKYKEFLVEACKKDISYDLKKYNATLEVVDGKIYVALPGCDFALVD